MGATNRVVFILMQVYLVLGALPNIQKCPVRDSNCLKSSFQEIVQALSPGIPEIGTESLDPLLVKHITVDLAGLKMTVRDSTIKGLKGIIVDKLSININKKQLQFDFHANLEVDGKYKASGKLLILPINGDGESHVILKNCKIFYDVIFDISKNEKGQDYIDLKSYKYKFEVEEGIGFKLTNLFNGNKMMSDSFLKFMNENWKILTKEFGWPMFDPPVKKFFYTLKTLLKSYPMEEIIVV